MNINWQIKFHRKTLVCIVSIHIMYHSITVRKYFSVYVLNIIQQYITCFIKAGIFKGNKAKSLYTSLCLTQIEII